MQWFLRDCRHTVQCEAPADEYTSCVRLADTTNVCYHKMFGVKVRFQQLRVARFLVRMLLRAALFV